MSAFPISSLKVLLRILLLLLLVSTSFPFPSCSVYTCFTRLSRVDSIKPRPINKTLHLIQTHQIVHSLNMSSSTPLLPKLLPKQDHKRSDHSMFLRVCHSPHSFISQITLRGLRGIIAFYMIGAFAAKMYYDIAVVQHGWRTVFEISNLAWLLLTCYETLGFVRILPSIQEIVHGC